ncbi:response regulator transcription factor [Fictibacillus sp. 7GRE50]|uniref:response regulator transcription factor n=1 Tax=Fictibacillus sp. 7GRE50 TaxID=2745878 RepID=UPI00272ED751|nr:response regulator transcription factor [Fictibacillus sp. 7GRE50]
MKVFLIHRVPILLEQIKLIINETLTSASIQSYESIQELNTKLLNKGDVLYIQFETYNQNLLKNLKSLQKKGVKIYIFIDSINESDIIYLLKQKYWGYFSIPLNYEELAESLKFLQVNKPYLQPSLSSILFSIYLDEPVNLFKPPNINLTKREWEVYQLIAKGLSNETIANQLFLTESTVKNHVSSILCKLNVPDRTSAVVKAFKNNWISF